MTAPNAFALGGKQDDADGDLSLRAAAEFEPQDVTALLEDLTEPAYGNMCPGLGVSLRLACIMLRLSKPEMVDMAQRMLEDEEGANNLADNLAHGSNHLSQLVEVLDTVMARLCSAAAVLSLNEA